MLSGFSWRPPLCFRSRSGFTAPLPCPTNSPSVPMRLSRFFLPILKENPKEAEIVSHRLMLRAGMMRQEAAGIYAWLPLGFRVLKKIEQIVREEQNRAGAHRTVDADAAACGSLARKRPLRRLWPGNAAHHRPAQARTAVRADQRGNDHRDFPRLRQILQKPAAQSLPHPVEVPRRAAPAFRRDARPRIPDEGCLFLRHRRGRGAAFLQPDVRRLLADLCADGIEGDPDARRNRPDRRRSQPRIHRARGDRRIRASFATATCSTCRCRARRSITTAICRRSSSNGPRSMPRPKTSTTPRVSTARCRPRRGCTPAASRSARSSISAPNIPTR